MRKLPSRYYSLLLKFFISAIMSGIVSAISVWRAGGIDGFPAIWLTSWAASWVVAFPALFVAMSLSARLVARIVNKPSA